MSSESSFHGELVSAPGVGFTVYYAKQNVTSSLFTRPGSPLNATTSCGPASCGEAEGCPAPSALGAQGWGRRRGCPGCGPGRGLPGESRLRGGEPGERRAGQRRGDSGQAGPGPPHTAVPGPCGCAGDTLTARALRACNEPGQGPGRGPASASRRLTPSSALTERNTRLSPRRPPWHRGPGVFLFLRAGARREQRAQTDKHTQPRHRRSSRKCHPHTRG